MFSPIFDYWAHIVDYESSVREGMDMLLEAFGCLVPWIACTREIAEFLDSSMPSLNLVNLRLRGSDSGAKIDDASIVHIGIRL